MVQYIPYLIISFVLSLALTPLVRKFALSRNIMDKPSARRVNTEPIARMGGVAVFSAFWLTIGLIILTKPELLIFVQDKIFGIDKNFFGVIIGSLVLLFIGLRDDVKGLKPAIKLLGHILAALIVVFFGIKIWWIHNPVTNLDLGLGAWTYLIVPVWIVLMINVVNWLDGLDGLATGIGAIASFILFFLSVNPAVSQNATGLLALVLLGALLGFLPYNFNPAKIFLGDVGSMFIGFMLGIFAIISGGKLATAALVMGFPILDALWVILRRALARQPIWQADRRHLHHRFLDAGLSQRHTVLILYTISAIFGVIALSSGTREKFIASFWLVGLMLFVGIILVSVDLKKRKYEKNRD